MENRQPAAIFLIGAKGSGKSFVGKLLESELGISFLRTESIWLAIKQEVIHSDADYLERGMEAVLSAAQELAARTTAFSLETTGAFDIIQEFIDRFKLFSQPYLVQLRAFTLRLPFDLVIENDPFADPEQILKAISDMRASFNAAH